MSKRTAESNKAILAAWNKEQELVREGKGTREWTPKQQQDILERGKAYDEDGIAFHGQHMKSAEMYPEYQGDPENIQFLTRTEHLEAHNGNWRNPTNWYFDPFTKEIKDFGDGPFIPCEIIMLMEPFVPISNSDLSSQKQTIKAKLESENRQNTSTQNTKVDNEKNKTPEISKSPEVQISKKKENIILRGLKTVGDFIVEHPVESIEIAGVAIGGVVKFISHVRGRNNSVTNTTTPNKSSSSNDTSSISNKISNIIEKANRSSPRENDVTGHKQRYHTKNGTIWKVKASYHRGGKNKK